MKIAVASVGEVPESAVEERFGRAPYFLIHDTDTGGFTSLANGGNAAAAHGAGTGTAQTVISEKVDVVVAGRFGPKAEAVLNAAGIKLVAWSQGTVQEAVDRVVNESVG